MTRKTLNDIQKKKTSSEKIVMLTAYDYASALVVDEADVDIILVGDSLANVILGYERTKEVTRAEMLHHAKAVNRAVTKSLLVGDMPFEAYQKDVSKCIDNAKRFIKEAGCDAIKLEWFDRCIEVTKDIVKAGIAVMGHVGLTPQTSENFKVQGRDAESAQEIIDHALALEKAGAFSLVLECLPNLLAEKITQAVTIPTIGIGSGVYCDGQVLVTHDLLGWQNNFKPKFVKRYSDIKNISLDAINQFSSEVRNGRFPDDSHSYHIKKEEMQKLKG